MRKYLIIGGAGFIGSYLTDALIKRGHQVIVIDNLLTSRKENLNQKAKFFKMDVCESRVFDIFKIEKPDIAYYLAGPINLRREINDPLFSKGLNILYGFKKILDYSHSFEIKKVIFLSSGGAIYSKAKIVPTSEENLTRPDSLYGLANLILEKFLDEYYKAFKLNFIILRLSNVYGPRQWESGVVPSFIKQILENKPLVINGDGTQTRDFIYIDDAIPALLIAEKSKKTGIFNVGSGQEISLNQLAKKIARILNMKVKPTHRFSKKEKIQRSVLDYSKIKKELNWEPKISLEQGLKKTIDWHNSNSLNKKP